MKKMCKGSFTVEASVIVPIILMMFVILIYILFYFHDKNIILGAVYETTAVGIERKYYDEAKLEQYLQSRIKGKLILFSNIKEEVEIENECVTVQCVARKRKMRIREKLSVNRTEPEKWIRNLQKVKVH